MAPEVVKGGNTGHDIVSRQIYVTLLHTLLYASNAIMTIPMPQILGMIAYVCWICERDKSITST